MKNFIDPIGNRTRDLPACSAVQLRAPQYQLQGSGVTEMYLTIQACHSYLNRRKHFIYAISF
jgi:hypothetical protein